MSYPITSRFLQQESFRSKGHLGIDFSMPNGTELRSIQSGEILKVVDYGSANIGKGVFVKWNDGKTAIYGHMRDISVNQGDKVSIGDLLGHSGNSGHVVGANGGYHLHFGLKSEDGKFLDPSPYIKSIQNMNNSQFLANLPQKEEIINQSQSFFDIFKDQSDIYGNFFQSLKLQLSHLINLIDYSMLIQHIQHLLQFFS